MNIDMAVDVISGHEPLPQFKAIPPVPDLRPEELVDTENWWE